MSLSDAASIATIVSAVVVLVAFWVAWRAALWAKQSFLIGQQTVREGREAGELFKEIALLQQRNLEVAQQLLVAAQATRRATERLPRHQQLMLELEQYESLLAHVTNIEATIRNQNRDTFRDARNALYDDLTLLPRAGLTRTHEFAAAHFEVALTFADNAKTELNGIISGLRQQFKDDHETPE